MQEPRTERIAVVDVLRAVALCGIAITHAEMGFLAGPPPTDDFMNFGQLDATVSRWVDVLVESKFFSIFSFLFGLSFAIQLENSRRKGKPFAGRFAWRLVLLFLIGMAHQALFNGDILMIYAVLGFFLIPLMRIRTAILLPLALVLLLNVPGQVMNVIATHSPPPTAEQQRENERINQVYGVGGKALYEANKHGTFVELAQVNYTHGLEMKWLYQLSTGRFWITFGCFLLGMCAGRANLFSDSPDNRRFFRRLLPGVGGTALLATLFGLYYSPAAPAQFVFASAVSGVQKAALAATYVAAVTLLFWRAPLGWLGGLAPLGRMGLTTYLAQSLVLALICCGFGLGLMGDFGSATGLFLGLALFTVQIFVARAWLARYSMGPVEWLWRSATYLEPIPLKRSRAGLEPA